MQVKTVKPINFLFFRVETTVNALASYAMVGQELIKEAVQYGLAITGPVHWHYAGFEGDEQKPFVLEISLPVAEVLDNYDGKFHFKRTNDFKCVSSVHEGAWHEIPASYGKLMQFIADEKLIPTGINREIYVNVDFKDHEANTSEIQIGLQ
jgi:effector-binding domain-containing protein